jgi:hypothetical protein
MNLTYIIGEPGSGKSWLVEELTAEADAEDTGSPFAMRRYDNGVTELGKRREEFSGTDALAMDVKPKVVQYLEAVRPKLVLAEGDRLANMPFFTAVRELGYDVFVYYLAGGEAALQGRLERGSKQNEQWLRGRATKVANLLTALQANGFQPLYLSPRMPGDYYREVMMDPVITAFTGKLAPKQTAEVW